MTSKMTPPPMYIRSPPLRSATRCLATTPAAPKAILRLAILELVSNRSLVSPGRAGRRVDCVLGRARSCATRTPCVLATRRPSHPGDEASI